MSYRIFDEVSLRAFVSRIKTAVIAHIPTKTSQLANDSGFITNTAINGFKKITWSTITIATSAWSNKTATVSVSGVTASNAVDVAPVEPTFDAYTSAGIRATEQGAGKLTFVCKTVPTVAISVNVKVYN